VDTPRIQVYNGIYHVNHLAVVRVAVHHHDTFSATGRLFPEFKTDLQAAEVGGDELSTNRRATKTRYHCVAISLFRTTATGPVQPSTLTSKASQPGHLTCGPTISSVSGN